MAIPHPLQDLSREEMLIARDIIAESHPGVVIEFREICLQEPPKVEMLKFLELEHKGAVSDSTVRPARQALCHYDTIGSDKLPRYNESIVDVNSRIRVVHDVISTDIAPSLTL